MRVGTFGTDSPWAPAASRYFGQRLAHVERLSTILRLTWPVLNGNNFGISLICKTVRNSGECCSEIESDDQLLVRLVCRLITNPHSSVLLDQL